MLPVAAIELARRVPEPGRERGFLRMLAMSALLVKEARPFLFHAILAVLLWAAGLALMLPVAEVEKPFTEAALGVALFVGGFVLAGCGLILESLGRSRVEQKRALLLTLPALGAQ
jgi:hypothetical protein